MKSNDTTASVTIRFPKDLKAALVKRANAEDRSFNKTVIRFLQKALKEFKHS